MPQENTLSAHQQRCIRWNEYLENLILDYNQSQRKLPAQKRTLLASVASISRFTGISAATISYWRNNKAYASIPKCIEIAQIFHVAVDDVIRAAGYDIRDQQYRQILQQISDDIQQNTVIVKEERHQLMGSLQNAAKTEIWLDVHHLFLKHVLWAILTFEHAESIEKARMIRVILNTYTV